jgi:serpin B
MRPAIHVLMAAGALGAAIAGTETIANGINGFGLELHRQLAPAGAGNIVVSPWSISSAMAMTYAGAAGKTRDEIAAVMRFGDDEMAAHAGIAAIAADLGKLAAESRARVEDPGRHGGPNTPLQIITANRLFGQDGPAFEEPFTKLLGQTYRAPMELVDFIGKTEAARIRINDWVAQQTVGRIKDLIPPGQLNEETRLVLANAIYLKAAWAETFDEVAAQPFFVTGDANPSMVPGLSKQGYYGYLESDDRHVISVPYEGGGLQFLIILPKSRDSLREIETSLDVGELAAATALPQHELRLSMPKFKIEPERVMLAEHLQRMGISSAFDKPMGSADFSRMAPRRPDDYLYISEVIHKAFIDVNKDGTEAAAATAVIMMRATAMPAEPPREVRVDRPFFFAVQHIGSGTCLFMGRVADPRRPATRAHP